MKRLLERIISECRDCPYYEWIEDHSEGNSDGNSNCKLATTCLGYDNKFPEIPIWCPLPRLNETSKTIIKT